MDEKIGPPPLQSEKELRDHYVATLKSLLDGLTDEERCGIIRSYCVECGNKDIKCQCWNDE